MDNSKASRDKYIRIREAYDVLSRTDTRQQYDLTLQRRTGNLEEPFIFDPRQTYKEYYRAQQQGQQQHDHYYWGW